MPKLLRLLDLRSQTSKVVEEALKAITMVISQVNCHTFASHIVQSLVQLLIVAPTEALMNSVMEVFCVLIQQLQDNFVMFMPKINSAMQARKIHHHQQYERLSKMLFENRLVPYPVKPIQPTIQAEIVVPDDSYTTDGRLLHKSNLPSLRRAWSTSQKNIKDDWLEWLRGLSSELIAQSPSPALRACTSLATKLQNLGTRLFNPAFVSCWTSLPEQYQTELIEALEYAANSPDTPNEVLQAILNLAEYMERNERPIPITLDKLSHYAVKSKSLAKALHYKEIQWTLDGTESAVEDLIKLNQNLNLNDAAIGILNYVQRTQPNLGERVEWYTRLEQWDEALGAYKQQEIDNGFTNDNTIGQMRCLLHLSDWSTLRLMMSKFWREASQAARVKAANIAINMAWAVGDFENMGEYLSVLSDKSRDKIFCRALMAVHNKDFQSALPLIREARLNAHSELSTALSESYTRGYSTVVYCQMLSELDEIIAYMSMDDYPQKQDMIVKTWSARLNGVQKNIDVWKKLLRLRTMALSPTSDMNSWIQFINMCRHSNQLQVCQQSIEMLVHEEHDNYLRYKAQQEGTAPPLRNIAGHSNRLHYRPYSDDASAKANYPRFDSEEGMQIMEDWLRSYCQPALTYTYLKYKWDKGLHIQAFNMLEDVKHDLSAKIGFDPCHPELFALSLDNTRFEGPSGRNNHLASSGNSSSHAGRTLRGAGWDGSSDLDTVLVNTLARFYFKSGEWLSHLRIEQERAQEVEQQRQQEDAPAPAAATTTATATTTTTTPVSAPGSVANTTPASAIASAGASTTSLLSSNASQLPINEQILEAYRMATVLDSKWYKAWHAWALRHYEDTQAYEREKNSLPQDILKKHIVPLSPGLLQGHPALHDQHHPARHAPLAHRVVQLRRL